MSPQQPSHQERRDSVRQWQEVITQARGFSNDLVLKAKSRQSIVSSPAIRMDFRSRFDHLLHRRFETLASSVCYSTQANSTDAFFRLLRRNDHQGLARCSAASFSRPLSANENYIHLNHAGKPITSWPDHSPPKFVQPIPSGVIPTQPQNQLQAQGTHTALLTGDISQGFKPKSQRLVCVVKEGACSRRNLVIALHAPELPSVHSPSLVGLASWANKSIRPSQLRDVVSAGWFGRKPLAKFDDRLRIRFRRHSLAGNQQASSA